MADASANSMPDDQALLHRIEQRDQIALQILYQRYSAMVYGLAYRITGSKVLAEEASQDTFIKVWEQGSRWDSRKGKFSSWLLTITRYTAIDRIRREQRHNSTPIESIAEPPTRIGIPDDPRLLDRQILRDLLSQIPPEQADLIQRAFFLDMTHKELADSLDLPLGTVKTRIRLGLQKLQALWHEAHQLRGESLKDTSK